MFDRPRTYLPSQELTESWLRAPIHGGLFPGSGDPEDASVRRDGDLITIDVPTFVDDDGHWSRPTGLPGTGHVTLSRNGEVIHDNDGWAYADVTVPAEPAQYELRMDTERREAWWPMSTRVTTRWTFDSASTTGPAALPLLELDYAMPDLNHLNSAGRNTKLTLQVRHQDAAASADVTAVAAWWSADDGASWQPATVKAKNQAYEVQVTAPAGTSHVSLKVAAKDAAGATVEQEIIRAYAVR
jgi:hypothetical protein